MISGLREIFARPPALPGPLKMDAQHLRVGPTRAFQSQCNLKMTIRQGGFRKAGQDRFSNPIVVDFEITSLEQTCTSNKPSSLQHGQRSMHFAG